MSNTIFTRSKYDPKKVKVKQKKGKKEVLITYGEDDIPMGAVRRVFTYNRTIYIFTDDNTQRRKVFDKFDVALRFVLGYYGVFVEEINKEKNEKRRRNGGWMPSERW